jgi:hypothetical protein
MIDGYRKKRSDAVNEDGERSRLKALGHEMPGDLEFADT